jgi:hypothetical protein
MNQPNQFLDLEIRIDPRWDDAYPVEIALGSGQEFQGYLSASILPWTSTGNPIKDGQRLFEALFADQSLRTAWDQALGQSPRRRIRLRIATGAPELHAIPWELAHKDGVPLSAIADTPFSRYLAVSKPWGSPVAGRPLRALALISDPHDIESRYGLPRADVELERQTLESAFASVNVNHLQADWLDPPVTLEKLEGALCDGGYHVLHYLGHGAYSEKRRQAALYMQDDDGLTRLVFDDDLAQLLARRGVQPHLAFLAACQSARTTAGTFLGLAPKLVSIGVPAVVAMQGLITVESALKFSATFYQRLMAHGLVDLAANEARSTLLTAARPDAAVPVLFMRLESGQLWEGTTTEVEGPLPPGPKYDVHVEGGQVGVIGDGAKIEGGIHFGTSKE